MHKNKGGNERWLYVKIVIELVVRKRNVREQDVTLVAVLHATLAHFVPSAIRL